MTILGIFDPAIFDPVIFDTGTAVATAPAGDGGEYRRKRKTIVTREPESIDRKKLEEQRKLREEIEEAYNTLHGLKRPIPEVVEAIRPYAVTPKKTNRLPPVAQVDFASLSRDLAAAKTILRAYEALLEEEEILFLLAA